MVKDDHQYLELGLEQLIMELILAANDNACKDVKRAVSGCLTDMQNVVRLPS